MTEAARPTGLSLGLYGASFVLVLVAGVSLGAAVLAELQDSTLLWVSAGLSCGAVILAVLALRLPRGSAR